MQKDAALKNLFDDHSPNDPIRILGIAGYFIRTFERFWRPSCRRKARAPSCDPDALLNLSQRGSGPERLRLSLPLGCTQELLPADTARVHLPAPQQIAVFAVVTVFHRVLHHP
jgi:hypothetical protein